MKHRILIVEDHDDTRACIQQLLECAGHRVVALASGDPMVSGIEVTTAGASESARPTMHSIIFDVLFRGAASRCTGGSSSPRKSKVHALPGAMRRAAPARRRCG